VERAPNHEGRVKARDISGASTEEPHRCVDTILRLAYVISS
jgi:hypothetical protein